MTSTKADRTSDTVDFFPHYFDMTKTSSADSASVTASKLIHALENPTPASSLKVEESVLAAILKTSEIFKCAVQSPETQQPQQGNLFPRV